MIGTGGCRPTVVAACRPAPIRAFGRRPALGAARRRGLDSGRLPALGDRDQQPDRRDQGRLRRRDRSLGGARHDRGLRPLPPGPVPRSVCRGRVVRPMPRGRGPPSHGRPHCSGLRSPRRVGSCGRAPVGSCRWHSAVRARARSVAVGTRGPCRTVRTGAGHTTVGTRARSTTIGTRARSTTIGTRARSTTIKTCGRRCMAGTRRRRTTIGACARRTAIGADGLRGTVGPACPIRLGRRHDRRVGVPRARAVG